MTALFIGLTVALFIICLCMAYGIKNQRERIEQLTHECETNKNLVVFWKGISDMKFTTKEAIQHIRKNIPIDEVFTHTEIRIFCEDHPAKINNQYTPPEY